MSFDALDIFIIGILLFAIIGILIGRGDDILRLVNGRRYEDPSRPKFDKKKEEKCILWYCILLLADEVVMKLGAAYWPPLIIVGIVIAVIGGAGAVVYLKKYAQIK